MLVILQKNVPNLGNVGDVVKVKDGYGRNYLVPRGMAVIADQSNRRRMAHQQREADAQREARARSLTVQLLTALRAVHGEGVMHRDVKLENLRFRGDPNTSPLVLLDFGQSESSAAPPPLPAVGTRAYMAPESAPPRRR